MRISIIRWNVSTIEGAFFVLIGMSYVTNLRIAQNLMVFDVLIAGYVVFGYLVGRFRVSRNVFHTILFLNLAIAPAAALLFFSKDQAYAFVFIAQFLFVVTILPLFVDVLVQRGKLDLFCRVLFVLLLLHAALLLYFAYLHFSKGRATFLYFQEMFAGRVSFGELVPNDVGHYLVLTLFLTYYLTPRGWLRLILSTGAMLCYLVTFSRTIILISIVYMVVKARRALILFSVLILPLILILGNSPSLPLNRLFDFNLDIRNKNEKTNTERIVMLRDGIAALPQALFHPLYHSSENKLDQSLFNVQSVHNVFLSIVLNFGLLSAGILFSGILVMLAHSVTRKSALAKYGDTFFFLLLDMTVVLLNATVATRTLWFPFALILAYGLTHSHEDTRSPILPTPFRRIRDKGLDSYAVVQ